MGELDAPDDERKYRSKHIQQPRNNKYPTQLHLLVIFLYLDARNHDYQVYFVLFVCRNCTFKYYVNEFLASRSQASAA
jgi:hypothetical protein